MSDRFGWTSDDWDKLSPEAKGNLIANIDYWEGRRQQERAKAEKEQEKMRRRNAR